MMTLMMIIILICSNNNNSDKNYNKNIVKNSMITNSEIVCLVSSLIRVILVYKLRTTANKLFNNAIRTSVTFWPSRRVCIQTTDAKYVRCCLQLFLEGNIYKKFARKTRLVSLSDPHWTQILQVNCLNNYRRTTCNYTSVVTLWSKYKAQQHHSSSH
jgi:hypothetical protein